MKNISIKLLLKKIFVREKWVTIYFTHNIDEYYKVKGNLINNNIETRTKNTNGFDGGRGSHQYGGTNNNYEILVKELDVHKANEIVHSR